MSSILDQQLPSVHYDYRPMIVGQVATVLNGNLDNTKNKFVFFLHNLIKLSSLNEFFFFDWLSSS
jgi:hypothetical protein